MDPMGIPASSCEDDLSIPSPYFDFGNILDIHFNLQQTLSGHTSCVVTDSTYPPGQIQNDAIHPASSAGPWIDASHPAMEPSFQPVPDHHQNFGGPLINPQCCNPRNKDIEDDSHSPPEVKE